MPADSRISDGGALSPAHRARRSQFDSTPPNDVAGRTSRAAATTASACAAVPGPPSGPASSKDNSGPAPFGICFLVISSVAGVTPG
jgi:hypothetical protein